MLSMGGTGTIFMALSAYALTTRKDFSYMRGFVMIGLLTVIIAAVANIFLQMSGLALAISTAAIGVFSALILFDTSRIIHGGETNYISATVALYLNIYNIFMSLLHLTGALGGDD
jgi:modulator of FtsH protease